LWDHIAQSSGELLVDGAARAQAAPHERNDKEDCKMAGADWHLRSVRNLKQLICTPGARDLLPTSRTVGLAARLLIKKIKFAYSEAVRYLNTPIQLFSPKFGLLSSEVMMNLQPADRSNPAHRRD
jgi:hypothetical protein